MTYVDLRPNDVRPVLVLVEGVWREGDLEVYRREPDGAWRGWVRWSEGVGTNRVGWFAEGGLKAVTERDGPAACLQVKAFGGDVSEELLDEFIE